MEFMLPLVGQIKGLRDFILCKIVVKLIGKINQNL